MLPEIIHIEDGKAKLDNKCFLMDLSNKGIDLGTTKIWREIYLDCYEDLTSLNRFQDYK